LVTRTAPECRRRSPRTRSSCPSMTRKRWQRRCGEPRADCRDHLLEPVPGQRGPLSAQTGLPRVPPRPHGRQRQSPHFRRSDDRLSPRAGRRPGALRHQPDLSTFGKIIRRRLPVGAFGGRAEIMDCLAPPARCTRRAPSAATRWRWRPASLPSKNSGITRNSKLETRNSKTGPYAKLEQLGAALEAGMKEAARSAGVPVRFNRCELDVLRLFHRRTGLESRRRHEIGPRAFQAVIFTACSTRAFIWRRRNSRPASSRPPTPRRTEPCAPLRPMPDRELVRAAASHPPAARTSSRCPPRCGRSRGSRPRYCDGAR